LVRDDFGGESIFTHYMRNSGYNTQLSISNYKPLQMKWASDHDFSSIISQKDWVVEIPLKQIEFFKPDILFISNPERFDSSFIKRLSYKPSLIIGRQVDYIPKKFADWTEYDVIISNNLQALNRAKKLGAKSVEFLSSGFPEIMTANVERMKKKWDVIFSGQLSSQHKRRIDYLTDVAKMPLDMNEGFSMGYYISMFQKPLLTAGISMHNCGAVYGYDMYRALKSGRIVLHIEIDHGEGDNKRIFEATGMGSFLITENFERTRQYFEPGVEIETFQNSIELNEKIYYYLSHPEEREAIALRGQKRCLQNHSMLKRSQMLDKIIHKYLNI